MLNAAASRLAVWGDPIAHSRSPQLHTAAYRALGLEWTYERRRVDRTGFSAALAGLDASWRGLSLTMPLKSDAFAASTTRDRRAELTGAVNTLLLTGAGAPAGFNTDVGGIVGALAEQGVDATPTARIIGAGATATSALAALAEIGARDIEIVARRPAAVLPLQDLGARLGVRVRRAGFDDPFGEAVPLTVATLPGDTPLTEETCDRLAASGGLLMDVVYGHWPTTLSQAWDRVGARATSGLGMLLHQAVLQIRIFVSGSPQTPLPDEPAVVDVMRRALMGD